MGRKTQIAVMVALMVAFANIKTADARQKCKAIAGQGGARHFPVFKSNGAKMLFLHDTEKRTFFVTSSGRTALRKCFPSLRYNTSVLKCKRTFVKQNYAAGIRYSGWHVACWAKSKGTKNHVGLDLTVTTQVSQFKVGIDVYRKLDLLERIALRAKNGELHSDYDRRIAAQDKRIKENKELAQKAYDKADDAQTRQAANITLRGSFFVTPKHQGASFKEDFAGGIGFDITWWFYRGVDFNGQKLVNVGVMTHLRWQYIMMTINGGSPDDDVPGNQIELLVNVALKIRPLSWLSLDLYTGLGGDVFHSQDMIGGYQDNGLIGGPNGNVSGQFLLNIGGGLTFHIKKFLVGIHLMGTYTPHGLLHPHFLDQSVWGPVKQFQAAATVGYIL